MTADGLADLTVEMKVDCSVDPMGHLSWALLSPDSPSGWDVTMAEMTVEETVVHWAACLDEMRVEKWAEMSAVTTVAPMVYSKAVHLVVYLGAKSVDSSVERWVVTSGIPKAAKLDVSKVDCLAHVKAAQWAARTVVR